MSKIESKKSSNNKTILIIILLVIVVILGILLCFLHIVNTFKESSIITTTGVNESKSTSTINEILQSFDCTNISYSSKLDNDKKSYYEIYVKFKYDLYENDESKEEYFVSIINALNSKLIKSYELIDERKNIDIWVNIDDKSFTINGVENYFENNAFTEVNSYTVIPKINAYKESSDLNKILNNDWKRDGLNLTQELISVDNEWLDYGTFKMNYNNRNINFVIFNSDYKDSLAEGITVGTSFNDIKEKLGNPTFKKANSMIGYKTSNAYMFFYKDEVVVYPCNDYSNSDFEELIFEYYEGEYDGYRTNLVVELLDEYIDLKSELIDNGVRLYSYSRGIEIFLYDDSSIEITVYNNYSFGQKMKNYAKDGKINLELDIDFVSLYENERNS